YSQDVSFLSSTDGVFTFTACRFSTFLDTLKIIPIARHVNRKLDPPMLTSGSVTPVTGKRFTVTAILEKACIASVKLSPIDRNAPKANGHFLNILIHRYRNTIYTNTRNAPPTSPYSSIIMANMKSL